MTGDPKRAKCNAVRDGVDAEIGGKCSQSSPPGACSVLGYATGRDRYLQAQYDPVSALTDRAVRAGKLKAFQADIAAAAETLQNTYGAGPPEAEWKDFTQCLWSPDGGPGGPNGNTYLSRRDLYAAGYQPHPALGGDFLFGELPAPVTDRVPVWLDRVFNPDLAVVVIFAVLVLVFAALIYRAHKWEKKAPLRAQAALEKKRAEFEKTDPYRGTKFESYPEDPNAKWKSLIPVYEAQGHVMRAYRKKLGMPPRGG